MRFFTRLHACVAFAVILILYSAWTGPSSRIQASIQKAWKGGSHRVVVFGDDWSDVGQYRVAPPPQSTVRDRDPDQGKLWTETLCEEVSTQTIIRKRYQLTHWQLAYDRIDNFARSIPSNVDISLVGSVVDSEIYANATANKRNETLALFDFKAQVQQFIDFEKRESVIPDRLRKSNQSTIFTVFFGLWDLLEYSALEKADALYAIDRSIEELFHNLNILAEHTSGTVKVILPKVMDLTFLPRFHQMRRDDSSPIIAQRQHQSVFLSTYWNTALSQAALDWGRGDLYMPNLNSMVMNQVRAQQLHSKHISDAFGYGKQKPLFDEVEQPCLSLETNGNSLQAADVKKCFNPTRHLFW